MKLQVISVTLSKEHIGYFEILFINVPKCSNKNRLDYTVLTKEIKHDIRQDLYIEEIIELYEI